MSTPDEITPAPTAGFDDEAVLLIGHGSRREKSNEQVRELAADLESRLGIPVDAAFLELSRSRRSTRPSRGSNPSHRRLPSSTARCSPRATSRTTFPWRSNRPGPSATSKSPTARIWESIPQFWTCWTTAPPQWRTGWASTARQTMSPSCSAVAARAIRTLTATCTSWPDYSTRAASSTGSRLRSSASPNRRSESLHGLSKHRPDAVVVLPYMLGDGVLTQRSGTGRRTSTPSTPTSMRCSRRPAGDRLPAAGRFRRPLGRGPHRQRRDVL